MVHVFRCSGGDDDPVPVLYMNNDHYQLPILLSILSVCFSLSLSPSLPPAVGDPIILGPEQTFSKDVDDKANAYFQAIYNRGMNVDRLLDLLKQFKDSINKKERVSTPPPKEKKNFFYSRIH